MLAMEMERCGWEPQWNPHRIQPLALLLAAKLLRLNRLEHEIPIPMSELVLLLGFEVMLLLLLPVLMLHGALVHRTQVSSQSLKRHSGLVAPLQVLFDKRLLILFRLDEHLLYR